MRNRPRCPKCNGTLVAEAASFRAPAHDRCLQCGYYREHPVRVVMKEIPPAEFKIYNQWNRLGMPLTLEQKRERNRKAQARHRAKVGKT